jgi:hypothetical protein
MTEEQFLKFWEDAIDHLKLQRMVLCTVWDYEARNFQNTITLKTRTNV